MAEPGGEILLGGAKLEEKSQLSLLRGEFQRASWFI